MDLERPRQALQHAAEQFTLSGSALYAALSRRAADDPELLSLAAEVPRGQLVGALLMSAVHFELLGSPRHELAGWLASLCPDPLPPEQAYPAFRAFCRGHRDGIVRTLRTRNLQTTSANRAAALLPALARVVTQAGAPPALVELGCGAGFNLLFDQGLHEYRRDGVTVFTVGSPTAPLRLACELIKSLDRAGAVPGLEPFPMPSVATRIGIDLQPPDLDDPDEERWLLAMNFPELTAHAAQLRSALEVRRRTPLRIERGDALARLPALSAKLDAPLCILHSNCLYQWTPEHRQALDDWLVAESRRRTIHRIGMERFAHLPPALAQLAAPGSIAPCDLVHTVYERGEARVTPLGHVESFGRWLEWHAPVVAAP